VDSLNPNEEEHKMLHSTKVICLVVLLALTMMDSANAELTITENWAVADAGKWGKTPVHTWDGEIPVVCDDPDTGTTFTWGAWVGLDPAKGKHFNINIDAEGKDRDGYVWWMGNPGPGGSFYTIFSPADSNVPGRYVENLDIVTIFGKSGDWVGQLVVRDANGDWYLSSSFDAVGGMTENTLAISALTWQEIVGEPAKDMNELDAGGPFAELTTKSNSDDGSGPGPLTTDVTDENSTSPDLSKVTGGGFVWVGGDAKFEFGPITWQGLEIPSTAYQAFPVDVVLHDPWNVALRWETGDGVVKETVYWGEDPNNLTDVTDQVVDNTVTLGQLELNKTHYWRVDSEQADGTVLPPTEGTWSFSVGEYAVIEDFEGFSDKDDNRIFQTWLDGWGYSMPEPGDPGNGTGSTVGYLDSPYAEQTIVHAGGVSMPFEYNNAGQDNKRLYAETELAFDAPQDWVSIGCKALTFYVYGDALSYPEATDKIYAGLEDSDGNFGDVHADAELKLEEWQEVNIDLKDFTDVDLAAVKKFYLGVGDSFNPQSGGFGSLFFDDIRAYVPRCMPDMSGLKGDLNNDCIVDQNDMDMLMAEYGLSEGDQTSLASGTLVTGALDDQGRTEFTEDWDAHSDNQGRYNDFYAIAQEDGQPILELSFPEGGFWKFPRMYTSANSDFEGTTTATIQWQAKEDKALCLYGVANNAHDTYFRFKFVLANDTWTGQNLGWVPDRSGEYAASVDNNGGRSPSYFPGLFNYQTLVNGMTSGEYCTLTLTVVADEQSCTINYTVKQGGSLKGSGTVTPIAIDFNTGIDQGQTATSWWIGGAYGKPEQEPFEHLTGGFIKSCDISSGAQLTVDLNGDGVVDDLDVAIIETEMGGQQVLWP
jgi:hypothetical protein